MRPLSFPSLLLSTASAASVAFAQEAPPSYEVARSVDSGAVLAVDSTVAVSFPVEVPGAPWMQLVFSRVDLPGHSLLRITSPRDGSVHQLDARTAAQWGNRSAYMNGDLLVVEVLAEPGTGPVRVALERVVVGLPPPQATTCGTTDDRLPSSDHRIARLMPTGCTGWLIEDCNKGFLTAGHCVGPGIATAMFRVPLSTANGTAQMSAPEDQYPVDPASIQFQNINVGADWCYFGCFANSNTGLTPYQREGAAFALQTVTALDPGAILRVTGHGFDASPAEWNYVQQTATGPWSGFGGGAVDHQVDTQGGNSGSPVILESTGAAIAVHSHGGCTALGDANHGTWIGQAALQQALANPRGVLACSGSWSAYCTAKVNSQGCTPSVAASANPSFAGGAGSCVVTATQVINNQNGIFFYGLTPAAIPFQGGTLCLTGSVTRTPVQNAGGNPPPADCSGSFTFDLGARIASGADPRLVRGATIVGQFWSRDPASTSYPSGLTNGIRLTIGP
ncbi:MAG: hypothetical protein NTY35_10520 [Planctomycetota bacterium]|nr:hypothetical protein [Planctomycetota bacterium]